MVDSAAGLRERVAANRRIAWPIALYFLLFVPLISFTAPTGSDPVDPSIQALQLLAYAITALMIGVARLSLTEFRIDKLTVILFLLFGTFLRLPSSTDDPSSVYSIYYGFGVVALALVGLILRSRSARNRWAPVSWGWLGLGLISGLGLALAIALLGTIASGSRFSLYTGPPLTTAGLIFAFLYAMGHSAIIEEPAFRGFLWGYLEQHRWKGVGIWLFQGALFWLSHFRYFDRPLMFWVALPAGGLIFGWLSWRSRSVAACLVAHAAYNGLGAFL